MTRRVVIVDDDPFMLEFAQEYLSTESMPMHIVTFQDASAALEWVREHTCSIIISDFNMPKMNGLEFFNTLRAIGIDVPFILLTGNDDPTVLNDTLAIKDAHFFRKVLDPVRMFKNLQHAVIHLIEMHEGKALLQGILDNMSECAIILHPDTLRIDILNQPSSNHIELPSDDREPLYASHLFDDSITMLLLNNESASLICELRNGQKVHVRRAVIQNEGDLHILILIAPDTTPLIASTP